MRNSTMLAGLVSALAFSPAFSGTQDDYRALRAWCVQRDLHRSDAAWQAQNNPQKYFHYQHYCSAMVAMRRAYGAKTKTDRRYRLQQVGNELQYVIDHASADHFLMPEVYALKGKAEVMLGRGVQAQASLGRALQLDPDHAGAYASIAEFHANNGDLAQALATVREGLSHAPESRALRVWEAELTAKLGARAQAVPAVRPKQAAPRTNDANAPVGQNGAAPTAPPEHSFPVPAAAAPQPVVPAGLPAATVESAPADSGAQAGSIRGN